MAERITVWCTGCGEAAHSVDADTAAIFLDHHDCCKGVMRARLDTPPDAPTWLLA